MAQGGFGGIILFGGYFNGGSATYYDQTYQWSGASWANITPTTRPSARSGGAMAKVYHGGAWKILLHGGDANDPTALKNDTWTWDENGNWTEFGSNTPSARQTAAIGTVAETSTGKVLIFGGLGNAISYPNLGGTWQFSGS